MFLNLLKFKRIISEQEIVELAGYTYRVATMLEVFEDCSAGRYQRNIVKSTKQGKKSLHHSEAEQVTLPEKQYSLFENFLTS